MILYFNSKITIENLTLDYSRSDYFYPVIYPKKNINEISKLKILKETLSSYSIIPFTKVIINIEFEKISDFEKQQFKIFVENLFNNSIINLSFKRPSSISEWIDDIRSYQYDLNFNDPVLVVMNHDHPFVDYQVNTLLFCIEKIFRIDKSDNKYKVFYYSHSPEVNDWIFNGRGDVKFKQISEGIYISNKIDNWIDSIVIMSFYTLIHIFQSANFSGTYIGRIDWPNVKYEKLNLIGYAYCREFFRHYDGYNHITGMRFIDEFSEKDIVKIGYPLDSDLNKKLDFYYSIWKISFLLAIKNRLKYSSFWHKSKRAIFVDFIENTFKVFEDSYLYQDQLSGLLNEQEKIILMNGLRNRVYYFANSIYLEVTTDIHIENLSYSGQLKNLIKSLFGK